jgi:nucleotide-binding universal stress UspA family protein
MKILVAVDGSKPALNAVKYAIKLVAALAPKAHSITLLNVHDNVGLQHAQSFLGQEAVDDYLHDLSEQELKAAKKLLHTSGIQYRTETRIGHVAQEIVDFAHAGKFDMLVMGAKGRSAMADMLIGSIAHRVLAMAKMPVVLVK